MNFLKTIQNSIYSPQFYSSLTTRSFKHSFGYFFLLILLLSFVNLLFLVKPLVLEAPKAIENVVQNLINCIPEGVEIKVTKGETSINQKEPYFIPECRKGWGNSSVVIDTKTPYSPSKFDEYKVAAWVTKNAIVYRRNNVETRTYSLKEMKDFTLNKSVTETFYKKFLPYLKFVGPMLLILSFVGIYLAYNFRLLQLLLLASLIWLLGKIFKYTLSFGQSYKIGLYAITLGLIVDLVVSLTSKFTYFHGFPFMVSILTLAVVLVNLILPKKTN